MARRRRRRAATTEAATGAADARAIPRFGASSTRRYSARPSCAPGADRSVNAAAARRRKCNSGSRTRRVSEPLSTVRYAGVIPGNRPGRMGPEVRTSRCWTDPPDRRPPRPRRSAAVRASATRPAPPEPEPLSPAPRVRGAAPPPRSPCWPMSLLWPLARVHRHQAGHAALHRRRHAGLRAERVQGPRAAKHPAGRSDHRSGDGQPGRNPARPARRGSAWPSAATCTTTRNSTLRCARAATCALRSRPSTAWFAPHRAPPARPWPVPPTTPAATPPCSRCRRHSTRTP